MSPALERKNTLYFDPNLHDLMRTNVASAFILLVLPPAPPDSAVSNGPAAYLIGSIIAVLILAYLVYTLIKPEKF
jgi:K+-transporting ATPase KdpF subunit